MSDGLGDPRAEAEGELALALIALEDGDTRHAAAHAGNAIASDPSLRDSYRALDRLSAAHDDVLGWYPEEVRYTGAAAARAYLLARAGSPDAAFGLLCAVTATAPGKPWAAGWLAPDGSPEPEFMARLEARDAANALLRLAVALPDPVPAEWSAPLSPWARAARWLVGAYPERSDLLAPLSALLRRFGDHDPGAREEAICWCQRAEDSGEPHATVMLGYALRAAGRPGEMHEAWLRALKLDPDNVDLRVDIAEQHAVSGNLPEAISWLEEGLLLEPGHPKAFPSCCAMRFVSDDDVAHLVRLADWWRDNPWHDYSHDMLSVACYQRPWLSVVPSGGFLAAGVPAAESVPSADAEEALRAAACDGYAPHPVAAYDTAVALSVLSLEDLLALLAYPPDVPRTPFWEREDPAYWPRVARVWACLGLLHHKTDEPWPSSVRRATLADLTAGAAGQAAEAAMNALVTAAWTDPQCRGDVAGLLGRRFLEEASADRPVPASAACLILSCPAMPAEVTALARELTR